MAKANLSLYGDNLIELNKHLLSTRYPYNDDQFAKMCLHIIVGQLPNVLNLRYNIYGSKLDLRISGTVLSPSGTNKGSVFNYMDEVCKALSGRAVAMIFKLMGKFTDSALVGTPGTKMEKHDKVDEFGDPIRDADGKLMKETIQVDNPMFGALHPSKHNNILAWSEGSQVLDIQQVSFNQSTMNILQQCMNTMGTADNIVSKTTGLGEIAYNTNCSIFLVTYKPNTLTEKVTGTGFLQRQIVLIREPTADEAREVAKNACAGLTRPPKFQEPIDDLVDRLKAVNAFAGTIDQLYVPDDVKSFLEYEQLSFHEKIKDSNILVRQKLGEFVRRWSVNILYNLMFHHAILSLRKEVNLSDVVYASDFLLPVWNAFASYLENALLMDKEETKIIGKQYAFVMVTYYRLETEAKERRDALPPEERESLSEIEGYILRDALVTRLASEWARSISAVEELMQQIETDLFVFKDVCSVPEEFRPTYHDSELPTQRWLKEKDGARRIISLK